MGNGKLNAMLNGKFKILESIKDESNKTIIKECLKFDPDERPSVQQITVLKKLENPMREIIHLKNYQNMTLTMTMTKEGKDFQSMNYILI